MAERRFEESGCGYGRLPARYGVLRLLVLLVALWSQAASVAAQDHSVLIIHSYHSGMPWTDAQHKGFIDVIRGSGMRVDIHVEYLDTLRHREQKDVMYENLRRTLLGKFQNRPPDVIAVSDNDALDFVLAVRPQLAPGAPVVFSGVNGFSPDLRTRYGNLTGVAEEASFKDTLEVMDQLLPGRRVLVLGERSSTFRGNFGSLQKANEQRRSPAQLEVFDDPVLSHIEARVRIAGPDTLVFILLRPVDDHGETVDSAIAVRAISTASKQPVFSAWDYMFGHGIVGGKLTSGEGHGEIAAKQVLRILKGAAADAIPVEWESANRYMFDYQQLRRFGLEGRPLPDGAVVINRPVSFVELHRDKVLAAAAAFALLLLFGIRLLVLNRSLRESRNLLDSIINNIPVTVFLKRASDLSFVLFNRAGEALLGRSREELLGRCDYDFFPKEQADFFTGKDREVLQQRDVLDVAEEPVQTPSGTRVLHTKKLALRNKDGQPSYLLGISEDITERKQAEQALRQYKDELEETVQRRTAELLLARDAAEAANKAKSVFLANMSHELRTPLNAILGFSDIIRRDPQLPVGLRDDVDIINRSGEHLLTLINGVLEIAKIEAGKLQLEIAAFDLTAMVRDVADMMQLRAAQKGLRLLLEMADGFPRYVLGDEARLRQIVVNLVGNAVKFTEQGGVTIRVDVRPNDRLHLLIEVEDTGPGISPEDQLRLFKPFVQLGEGGEQKGTGLGLTITRQFVELMGGHIAVHSEPGRGSVFRVDVPVDPANGPPEVEDKDEPRGEVVGLEPGQPSYRILIVEDQYENRLLLERLMTALGFEVRVAEDGEQAVAQFEAWHPHLIWMDWRMPKMDGKAATQRIRALPGGGEVRIVAVTASAFREQQQEILAAGTDDFVRKPYRPEELYDCMARLLGLRYHYVVFSKARRAPVDLTPAMLSALPQALRAELKDALVTLDPDRIAAVVDRIGRHDAETQRALSDLAGAFDYPTILNALETLEVEQS